MMIGEQKSFKAADNVGCCRNKKYYFQKKNLKYLFKQNFSLMLKD